jgi:hypothetical protein
MTRYAVTLCLGVLLSLPLTAAPQEALFSTCAWWRNLSSKVDEVYKIGFAHGIVVGQLADLLSTPSSPDAKALEPMWRAGLVPLLQKPAMMAEVFDKKCGDYRNAPLMLHHVAFLGTLEFGGLSQAKSDAALDLLRAPNDVPYATILSVLAKK